jgi:inner membrane protein
VRASAALCSVLANNLPDLDVLYASFWPPRPLGNLLHHRGHTHTLLLALPAAWLLAELCFRALRRRSPGAQAQERRLLLGLAAAGVVLHLVLDFFNNYGVHPFWPLSDRWFYGDTVFIVEPFWWALVIPFITPALTRRWLSSALWVLLAALLVVCWFVPFVAPWTRFALVCVTVLGAWLGRRSSESWRLALALAGAVGVPLVFWGASLCAKAELREASVAAFPALDVQDIATTPQPGNPACWEGLIAGEQGGVYLVLRATVALFGAPANGCAVGLEVEPSAPTSPLTRSNHGGVRWVSQYAEKVSELARLRREDCRFRALLHFARLPYVARARHMAGDLRYDRNPTADFSDIPLPGSSGEEACPTLVPSWREPRASLFQP